MYLIYNNTIDRKIYDHGWGNGYVALPKGHPWYGVDYDEIPALVHGGLTYGQQVDEWWVIGYDTSHYRDTLDLWPMSRVLKETKKLMDQAIEACP